MLFGLGIVVIGLLFLLEVIIPGFKVNMDIVWPVIIIFFSISEILKKRKIDLFLSIFFFIGLWFLLLNLEYIPMDMKKIFWPIMIMIVGLSIVFSSVQFRTKMKKIRNESTSGATTYYGVFAGVEEKVKTNDFKGMTIYSIFGGVDLDLRDVQMKEESVVITVYSIFGGTELLMPKEYNIVMNSNAIFAGNENKCSNEYKEKGKTIYINCVSVFGGTELK